MQLRQPLNIGAELLKLFVGTDVAANANDSKDGYWSRLEGWILVEDRGVLLTETQRQRDRERERGR